MRKFSSLSEVSNLGISSFLSLGQLLPHSLIKENIKWLRNCMNFGGLSQDQSMKGETGETQHSLLSLVWYIANITVALAVSLSNTTIIILT